MKRLIEEMVFSGFVTDWRFAGAPTSRWPSFANATTDGVVRPPSALGMTVGSPPSSTATQRVRRAEVDADGSCHVVNPSVGLVDRLRKSKPDIADLAAPVRSARRPAGWRAPDRRSTKGAFPLLQLRAARRPAPAETTSPGAIAGIPGGYGATISAATRPGGVLGANRLPRGEERLPRGHGRLRRDVPDGARGSRRAWLASPAPRTRRAARRTGAPPRPRCPRSSAAGRAGRGWRARSGCPARRGRPRPRARPRPCPGGRGRASSGRRRRRATRPSTSARRPRTYAASRTVSPRSSSPRVAMIIRARSRLARSAAETLVVWRSSNASSSRSRSRKPPRARRKALCVKAARVLCDEATKASAPAARACGGTAGWKPKCAPQAWSITSGTPAP